jgi:tetratricopeptide (TPR) repeat protein
VRVNVQLVNAQNDSHLWAETHDRKLTDIFSVESEIVKGIAEALQAKLTGREEQALAVKPTNNPEAYDAYLRGLAFEARSRYPFLTRDLAREAIGFYERAVQLDPKFAAAWARLSRAHAFLYFGRADTTPATRRDAAKSALENAQKLEPNSPETLLALGYYQYHVLSDYGLARTTFERVSKMLPNSSEVLWRSPALPDARGTGIKALSTTNKPSPWTHVTGSYLGTRHGITPCFDSFRPRLRSRIECWILGRTIRL